jgi:methyl-accepting chemotaxis protein
MFESGNLLAKSVEDNTGKVQGINTNLSTLRVNMEEGSRFCQKVNSHLVNVVNDIRELAQMTSQVQAYTQSIDQKAADATTSAKANKQRTEEEIQRIQARMLSASERASQIHMVQDIAQKVEVIAVQAQMLSLNASIEAARAGTVGRGFAVVAENVGKLSSEIAGYVKDIKQTSGTVIDAVGQLQKEAAEISAYIDSTVMEDYESFVQIGQQYRDGSSQIHNEMRVLEGNAQKISSDISGIETSVQEISSYVADSAEKVSHVNHLSDQVAENMDHLIAVAETNQANATSLNGRIRAYQV